MTNKTYLIIIICVSLVTHFLFFGQPKETVFDEVHFGKFISGYFTHEYFFDIHPPLGKLLISGMGYLTNFEPGFSFAEIGQQFPDRHYLWLRLLPILAGTLLPIVIFLLIIRLGLSPLAAFTGGILISLDNALIVQSRFILLDPFLLLFGFAALLFYFIFKNRSSWRYLLMSGAAASLAISVKWTGGTFLALIIILYFISWLKSQNKIKDLIRGIVCLIIVPLILYFTIFALHFSLLNKSGPGDAFMTPEFRKTLVGSNDNTNTLLRPLNIFQKFTELNIQMYESNATLTAGHPYSSKWYTWPFMIRPIYYWNGSTVSTGSLQAGSPQDGSTRSTDSGQADSPLDQSRIYLLGNPAIWWTSTVAILYLLLGLLHDLYKRAQPKLIPELLIGAYLLNILPFIGISRAMFLYHYFIALLLAVIALIYLLDQLPSSETPSAGSIRINKKRAFSALLIASLAMFIFFAPLSYGRPLTEKAYHLRTWLGSWI